MGMDLNTPADDEVWQLVVHPALTGDLIAWLAGRGLQLGRYPHSDDDLPTWIVSPTDERVKAMEARERVEEFLRAENDRAIDADGAQ